MVGPNGIRWQMDFPNLYNFCTMLYWMAPRAYQLFLGTPTSPNFVGPTGSSIVKAASTIEMEEGVMPYKMVTWLSLSSRQSGLSIISRNAQATVIPCVVRMDAITINQGVHLKDDVLVQIKPPLTREEATNLVEGGWGEMLASLSKLSLVKKVEEIFVTDLEGSFPYSVGVHHNTTQKKGEEHTAEQEELNQERDDNIAPGEAIAEEVPEGKTMPRSNKHRSTSTPLLSKVTSPAQVYIHKRQM